LGFLVEEKINRQILLASLISESRFRISAPAFLLCHWNLFSYRIVPFLKCPPMYKSMAAFGTMFLSTGGYLKAGTGFRKNVSEMIFKKGKQKLKM
jgi:hypothetical protein